MVFIIGVAIAFLTVGIIANNKQNLIISIVGLAVSIVLLILNKRLKGWFEFFAMLLALGGYIFQTWRNENIYFTRNTPAELFYSGYAFALAHQILISRIVHYSYVLFFDLGILAVRIGFYGVGDDVFNFVMHLCFDIFMLYITFDKERTERMTFKNFWNYRQEFSKFKLFVTKDVPQAIYIINPEKKVLFYNDSYAKKFDRYDKQNAQSQLQKIKIEKKSIEAEDKALMSMSFDTLDKLIDHLIEDAGKNLKEDSSISLQATFQDESQKMMFAIKVFPIRWDQTKCFAIILNDITHLETIIRLKVADVNKDRVIASVSHELKTPINGMLGMAQIMENMNSDLKLSHYINLLKNNCDLLLSIVNSILDLQLIRAKKLRISPSRFSLVEILNQLKSLFVFHCNQRNLSFDIDVDPEVPGHIFTDKGRLVQVLVHLVGNAVKFTQSGGIRVEVKCSTDDKNSITLCVTDTGIGIKEEDKADLFKMSKMHDNGMGVSSHGAGLGLTIANELALLLGDSDKGIKCESEVGKGTKFSFKIAAFIKTAKSHTYIEDDDFVDREYIRKTNEAKLFNAISPTLPLRTLNTKSSVYNFRQTTTDVISIHDIRTEEVRREDRMSYIKDNHVLLVDDNPFNLMIAEHFLNQNGYKTKLALNGQESIGVAIEAASSGKPFCIIFMDLQMPIMDGYEATISLRKLMKEKKIPEAPIIALSANDRDEDKERCYSVGMNAHLAKPLKEKDLLDVIAKYLRN